ncbi:hypothetical protein GPECTOR_4g859 [Gonium pectorale]|uniref:TATA element modulatory factor 1 TATA binding domain-containing protein n=1 Tax=Gonium pectorale TaxID=33097 RepID=A0A150GYN0_GONPE|nr:hypothetical protein GPECTOR_4g859 [Gonium pectorale]|eukprot:KXZ54788.1 hypothetical protein GPECTOR_4g859 [Gonium pectorale]
MSVEPPADSQGTWSLGAVVSVLQTKLTTALRLLGERTEELDEVRGELQRVKAVYRHDVDLLASLLTVPPAYEGDGALQPAARRAQEMHSFMSFINA